MGESHCVSVKFKRTNLVCVVRSDGQRGETIEHVRKNGLHVEMELLGIHRRQIITKAHTRIVEYRLEATVQFGECLVQVTGRQTIEDFEEDLVGEGFQSRDRTRIFLHRIHWICTEWSTNAAIVQQAASRWVLTLTRRTDAIELAE